MIELRRDDRAVSIALTHAMTLGITTILVVALLISGGTVLDSETERGVSDSLETTGERLASEIAHVDGLDSTDGETNEISLTLEYPETVAGSRYRVGFVDGCREIATALSVSEHCLELTATGIDDPVYIPLGEVAADVDTDRSVQGGTIAIVHDGDELGVENP